MAEWVWQGCHTLLQIAEMQLSAKVEIKFDIDMLHSYSNVSSTKYKCLKIW